METIIWKNCLLFLPGLNICFHGLKKKNHNFILFQFAFLYFQKSFFNFLYNFYLQIILKPICHIWIFLENELYAKWVMYIETKWPWEKQVWFHLININWQICTSLDFVISKGKSSEKIRSSPAEVFLGKGVLKFAAYFLNTFF